MKCQCCGEPKANPHVVGSKLLKDTKLRLCTSCKNSKHEPRYLVILASVSSLGVRDYVVNHRYCGKELSAREITH